MNTLPVTGERYLSTPLFGEIGEDMTEEEVALSKSTPNYRFEALGVNYKSVDMASVEYQENARA